MKLISSKRVSDFYSDNRKSKIKNPKWAWGLAIVFAFVLCGVVAEAQQPAKIPKIGFLSSGTGSSGSTFRSEVFRQQLRELGYVEGKNIAFESRYGEDNFDRLPALADELVRLKVDVLVINTTPAALAAKNATRTIPIVFLGVSDPVVAGLVDSLARPGGNITGFTNIAPVLAGKRLELLKETVSKLSRIAVLWDPKAPGSTQQWKESQLPARELGLQLHSMEVSSADKYEDAFKEATKARSGALAVTQNPLADKKSASGNLPSEGICRERRLDVIRTRPGRTTEARRDLHRQDPEGRQASRTTGRAADEV
jgi:putative ABC transport system substrate-binding protein